MTNKLILDNKAVIAPIFQGGGSLFPHSYNLVSLKYLVCLTTAPWLMGLKDSTVSPFHSQYLEQCNVFKLNPGVKEDLHDGGITQVYNTDRNIFRHNFLDLKVNS